jgi:hypothetical protein
LLAFGFCFIFAGREGRGIVETPKEASKLSPLQSERRRSQRVLLVIPVDIAWTGKDGKPVKVAAETEVVNAHGALLRMKSQGILLSAIPKEIDLTHRHTGKTTKARIVGGGSSAQAQDGMMRIAVELDVASESFWGVTLPPAPAESTAVRTSLKKPLTPGSPVAAAPQRPRTGQPAGHPPSTAGKGSPPR